MKKLQSVLSASLILCAVISAPQVVFAETQTVASYANEQSRNKDLVTQLSNQIMSNVNVESLGRYFAHDLVQHDPLIANGRRSMVDSIAKLRQAAPTSKLTVKHVLAQQDLVFVQSQLSSTPENELSGTNRYDIYRIEHGVVAEHWLVQAPVAKRSASGNSPFSNLYQYPTPPAPLSKQRVEMNRLLVQGLSEEVFGNRNFALLDRLWATGYLQHNPYVGNGRAALAEVIEYIAPVGSNYRVKLAMADGDLALVCAQSYDPGADPTNEFGGSAVCDMYRVANFELVEHWDVYQAVPQASVSGNAILSRLQRSHH